MQAAVQSLQPPALLTSVSGIQTSNSTSHDRAASTRPEEASAVFQTSSDSLTFSREPNQHKRFFLDVCSGSSRPLSTAVLSKGGGTLSIDILIHNSMDLLDDNFFFNC